ncbi:MAG: RluA family pseudouridine synthase [Chlamydiales bacterium]|nr:RluA family pseudouridine synthase [Chlamydiales bacterium]
MKWRVTSKEAGMKLLAFLREKDRGVHSVKLLKKAIDEKRCSVNKKVERFASYTLVEKDLIELDLSEVTTLSAPQTLSCPILFEDEHLLVVDKPAGLISEDDRLNALLPQYKGGLLLIHRLDKETSGALMLAKSAAVKEAFIALFRKKEVVKIYLALVDGRFERKEGKIENYLVKKGSFAGQTIWGTSPKGLKHELAITFWKREKMGSQATLLVCQPITGKTHQLRVHLSAIGHPILGDFQYEKKFTCSLKPRRHLLHAYLLRFTHPFTQKEVEIKAPLPQDFLDAVKTLKLV